MVAPIGWQGLLQANWTWLAVVPFAVLLSHLAYSLAYRQMAQASPGPDMGAEQAMVMVTTGFAPFSPRGGFAMDNEGFRNLGMSKRGAARRVLTLGMLEYAILAPATFGCALYMSVKVQFAQAGLLSSWIVGVPLGTVVAIGLMLRYRRVGRRGTWWSQIVHVVEGMEETLTIVRSWPNGPVALAGMSGYWAADIAALAACLMIFTRHAGVSLAALVVGYATGYALTRRTLPLAGAGAVEALLPFALTWVGYTLPTAVLAVVAYRLFNLWFAVIPALAGLRQLRSRQPHASTAITEGSRTYPTAIALEPPGRGSR
jgi:uncharacterized membrane protein YbhN (UPF0104 family)